MAAISTTLLTGPGPVYYIYRKKNRWLGLCFRLNSKTVAVQQSKLPACMHACLILEPTWLTTYDLDPTMPSGTMD